MRTVAGSARSLVCKDRRVNVAKWVLRANKVLKASGAKQALKVLRAI